MVALLEWSIPGTLNALLTVLTLGHSIKAVYQWHSSSSSEQSRNRTVHTVHSDLKSVYWQVSVVPAHSHNEPRNLIIPNCTRRSDCTNIIRRLFVDVGGAASWSARPCRDVEVMQTPAGKHLVCYFICCCFQSTSSH